MREAFFLLNITNMIILVMFGLTGDLVVNAFFTSWLASGWLLGGVAATLLLFLSIQPLTKPKNHSATSILHVSYDSTREVIQEINKEFAKKWKQDFGLDILVGQSNGGSGSQARSLLDGLPGDVTSLAIYPDMAAVGAKGLLPKNWQERPGVKTPPWSTLIVFLVRSGNPKSIRNWRDLTRDGVSVVLPSPKISGNGKLAFLGGWGDAYLKNRSTEEANAYIQRLYRNVPVMDASARATAATFFQKGIGDVMVAWENEAMMAIQESMNQLELVYPSRTFKASPPICLVETVADKHGTKEIAEEYISYFYSPQAQRILARFGFRPVHEEIFQECAGKFPQVKQFSLNDLGLDWGRAQELFFREGALFDQVFLEISKRK